MSQVDPSRARVRSAELNEIAILLATACRPGEESEAADLELLYSLLVRQQHGHFSSLLASHRLVMRRLLLQSPSRTSAIQHSNNMAGAGMDRLRRVLREVMACKGNTTAHDKAALRYMTLENMEVLKLPLLHTAQSTAPTMCCAIRAKDLSSFLGQLASSLLEEQTDRSTRNLRHPIYKGHLVVIVEADKGGQVMKFAWRIGANALIAMGMYEAGDFYSNLLTFSAPWYDQLLDIQEYGVMVRRRRGDT